MIADSIARQGSWFLRSRNYVLLAFAPLALLVVTQPEPIEVAFGQMIDTLFESVCIALAFVGLAIRAYVVGHLPERASGYNTATQAAGTLNTSGLYSLTRNPLHLGNAVTYMSIACFLQNVWFAALVVLFLIIYFERIIAAEEELLAEKFGDSYRRWACEVPVFFPRLKGWRAPELPFSIRNVLRREYSGPFAIIAVLFALDQSREYLAGTRPPFDPDWVAALAAGALAYVLLRWAKKRTTLLNEPDVIQGDAGVRTRTPAGTKGAPDHPSGAKNTMVTVLPPAHGTNYWTVKIVEEPGGDGIVSRFYGPDSAERAYAYADSLRPTVSAEFAGPYEDALRMIRGAVETLFGAAANLPSLEVIGPTPADQAEEIVAALQRVEMPDVNETKPPRQ